MTDRYSPAQPWSPLPSSGPTPPQRSSAASYQWSPGPAGPTVGPPAPTGPFPPAGPFAPMGRSRFPEPPGAPRRRGTSGVLIAVLAVVALLAVGGGAAWFFWWRPARTTPVATAPQPTPAGEGQLAPASGGPQSGSVPGGASPQTPQASGLPGPSRIAEDAALTQLAEMHKESLSRLQLNGQWVAQVASKWVGITDPLQTASDGTHVFSAVDILAESQRMSRLASDPSHVYVLWATDFGKSSTGPGGAPIWVTLVDNGFGSASAVNQWCARAFPGKSPQEVANTCAPRTLSQPHN